MYFFFKKKKNNETTKSKTNVVSPGIKFDCEFEELYNNESLSSFSIGSNSK